MCVRRFFSLGAAVLWMAALVSCISLPNTNGSYLTDVESTKIVWRNEADGIERFDYADSFIDYHIVKINLHKKWTLESYPHSSDWVRPISVRRFAKKHGSAVAINANPFQFTTKYIPWSKIKPVGICKEGGTLYSAPNSRYAALAFYEEDDGSLRADIVDSQQDLEETPAVHAFGGFFTVLRDGKIREFPQINDVRSAAAIADGGKTLYLFVGKNLSYPDCARIFLHLGATVAMEFDGGSSSQMAVLGKNAFTNIPPRNVAAIFGLKRK